MLRQLSIWWLLLVVGVAVNAPAQVDVVKGMKKKIFVSGFSGDAQVAGKLMTVLNSDMRLSGSLALSVAEVADFVQQGAVRGDVVECSVVQKATQKSMLSKAYPVSTDARKLAHVISDDIVMALTGERGIAQTKIAFILTRGKGKELAMMDYDGANMRQLTSDNTISAHPRWSPDGRKLIYMSYLQSGPDVFEADLVTQARRRVSAFRGLNAGAVYSPDGQTIALTLSKDGNPALYTMSAGGGGLKRLTNSRGAQSSPTWSPDGQRIAYVSDETGTPQIWVISREGGESTRLTVSPSYNTEPCWSHPPAGSAMKPMLAVTSRIGGRFQIGLFEEGTREVRPLGSDDADTQDPSWAPNGRHLVLCKLVNWKPRLYLLDVPTGEQVELPVVEGGLSEPAWGP